MKTAIEWLIEQWPILESQLPPQLIEQAKEMEKEQIVNAASDHCYPTGELARIDAEDYYNQTFKSE
jgi:hypothetical protein